MTHRLWWRVDEVLPLAEHAAATPRHITTPQQTHARFSETAALIWTRDTDGDWLSSNGDPEWYDATGRTHRVRAGTWIHTATGSTGNLAQKHDGQALLPVHLEHLSGLRTLVELLRFARANEVHWLGVDPEPGMDDVNGRYVISHTRSGLIPPDAVWIPATVTSAAVGGGAFSALVAEGYTSSVGGVVARFSHDEMWQIARHLIDVHDDLDVSRFPKLRSAGDFVLVERERWNEGGVPITRVEEDRVRRDPDGYYALGAHQWKWSLHQPDEAGGLVQDHRPGTDVDRRDSPSLPQLPPGGRLLSADEAVDLLVTGDHPDSRHGSLVVDATLIEAIRQGQIVACLLANGQVAFTRATQNPAGPTNPATPGELTPHPESPTDE
jgi:hypothetical protein